jgi:hypothetical protein
LGRRRARSARRTTDARAHAARAAYAVREGALAKHPAFKGVRVAEQAGKVTFSRVPLASVALFAKVIAGVRLAAVG